MAIPILTVAPREMKGLNQAIDANLLDLSYSPDCQNIDVSEGILSVRRGSSLFNGTVGFPVAAAPYTIHKILQFSDARDIGLPAYVIGTMDGVTIRWYAWLSNSSGTKEWRLITTTAGGATAAMTSVDPRRAYGINYPISGNKRLIVLGNSKPFKLEFSMSGSEERIHATEISAAPNGDFMTLHRERMWIGNAFDNKVYYSNAFNPEDWTTAGQTGEIIIETGDGDKIIGVENLLDDVIIFKQNTIWRVSGDIPSEYSLSQVYATQGTIHAKSICSDGSYCYFAGADGIYQYTGNDAVPVLTDAIKTVFKSMQSVKCKMHDSVLYAWDMRTGTGYAGKHIAYDVIRKKVSIVKAQDIYDLEIVLQVGSINKVLYTDGLYIYDLDNSLLFRTMAIEAYWITPETDLGSPNASKTLTDMYFTGWGSTNAGAAGGQVKITAYYNESGTQKNKEKTVTLQTTRKLHNVQWNVTGRLFKFKIENVSGSIFNLSNLQFVFEVDRD